MKHEHGIRFPRRHVRMACALRTEGQRLDGVSGNISVTGMYVRVPVAQLERVELSPGTRLTVAFALPGEGEVETAAEIVWTKDDYDVGGRAMIGIGLHFVDSSVEARLRLERFVKEFRYSLMLVGASDEALVSRAEAALAEHYRVLRCRTVVQALARMDEEELGALILDEGVPGALARDLVAKWARVFPHSQIIKIVLGEESTGDHVEDLVSLGHVFHHFSKPLPLDLLVSIVRRTIEMYAVTKENERLNAEIERANESLRRENAYLRRRAAGVEDFEGIVGKSEALRRVLEDLERIRRSEATVHVTGETGTGKELVARVLHRGGPRAEAPFVTVNCGGMTETLLQSTLFGHVRGAFTGADRDRPGLFQEAHRGTLFLDEVAELSLSTQAALLRALQFGEVVPVGATRAARVDVRLLSATHTGLLDAVRAGRFREDLYFRLVVIEVRLPPLRERAGDVPLLAQHHLDVLCERYGKSCPGFTFEAMEVLERYAWPGNVRELHNEIERALVLVDPGARIGVELLSPRLREGTSARGVALSIAAPGLSYDEAVRELERSMIHAALTETGGVVTKAAERLGMERSRLAKLRRRLGLV